MNIKLDFSASDANWALRALLFIDVLLILLYLAGAPLGLPGRIRQMLDLNAESTIPTWFASSQLLVTGFLFLIVGQTARARSEFSHVFFPSIGACFIALSMDEASGIHESITALLQKFSFFPRFTDGHGIWIPIYIVTALLLAALLRRDIFAMFLNFRKEALVLGFGIGVFIFGGIGLEIVDYSIPSDGANARIEKWLVVAEEFLELAGISIALYSSLLLVRRLD